MPLSRRTGNLILRSNEQDRKAADRTEPSRHACMRDGARIHDAQRVSFSERCLDEVRHEVSHNPGDSVLGRRPVER